jgi:hypothetical protein
MSRGLIVIKLTRGRKSLRESERINPPVIFKQLTSQREFINFQLSLSLSSINTNQNNLPLSSYLPNNNHNLPLTLQAGKPQSMKLTQVSFKHSHTSFCTCDKIKTV